MQKFPLFRTRAFQVDTARQPESPATLKRIIRTCSEFGYNQCHLYVENGIMLDSFGAAGRGLEKKHVRELASFSASLGVELVPSLNLLGHVENFLEHDEFKKMSETREGPRQFEQKSVSCLCPSLEETRTWAGEVIAEVSELFPSPNLHAGLDETWSLGSCSLCAKKAAEAGLGLLFAEFANFLNAEAKNRGKTMWMWADMCFYYRNALENLSGDIVMADWHYDEIGETPCLSFFNWRRTDTSAILRKNGFKVVLAGSRDIRNTLSLTRYSEGLGIDSFLVTEWEGGKRFQDNVTLDRCIAGHILSAGEIPSPEMTGRRLLPGYNDEERKLFLTAVESRASDSRPAMQILRGQKSSLLHKTAISEIMGRSIEERAGNLNREIRLSARGMLKKKIRESRSLNIQMAEMERAVRDCREWLSLLDALSRDYKEEKNSRRIYSIAREIAESLKSLHEKTTAFVNNPVPENYPFPAVEIVLEPVIIDMCSHYCMLEASEDGEGYSTVYETASLPLGMKEIRTPAEFAPSFLNISFFGYARVGVSGIRYETPSETFLPGRVLETGGRVIEPEHLLSHDSKAALFNDADVESQWERHGETRRNNVLLGF